MAEKNPGQPADGEVPGSTDPPTVRGVPGEWDAEAVGQVGGEGSQAETLYHNDGRVVEDALLPSAASRLVAWLRDGSEPSDEDGLGLEEERLPRIEGYVLSRRLGGGGGGTVYAGYRSGSDKLLAIKILNRGLGKASGDTTARRAWRELEVLSQLRLAALPRVLDYGQHGGRLYIVTEYVDGPALDAHCEAARLDLRGRVELLARVAEAVQELHEQGVIHRDLKPSNILVAKSGRPVIIDFGIAALLAQDVMETLTAEGAPIGSPGFMAPEQARGERERMSTRTDVYALGAMGYLLLTGSTPHDLDGTLHAVVRRIAEEEARDPRVLAPTLRRPLAAVLRKATAARGEERYESAAGLARDLQRWLTGEPVSATGPTRWGVMVRWVARHPVIATGVVCAVMVLATGAGIGGTWWYFDRAPFQIVHTQHAPIAELVTRSGRVLHEWSGGEGNISSALLLGRGDIHGRRLALIGYGFDSDREGALCAFDPARPNAALWCSRPSLPDELRWAVRYRPQEADQFLSHVQFGADVFPEHTGHEIVVTYRHVPFSPTVIRIYSHDGEVLYELWHDGYVFGVQWLPEPRLLVVVAANSELQWAHRGIHSRAGSDPIVVFAVRPVRGQTGAFVGESILASSIEAAWYKWLLPANEAAAFCASNSSLSAPAGMHSPRNHVGLRVSRGWDHGGVEMVLDQDGEIVDRVACAVYRSDQGNPDCEVWRLSDLPPELAREDRMGPPEIRR